MWCRWCCGDVGFNNDGEIVCSVYESDLPSPNHLSGSSKQQVFKYLVLKANSIETCLTFVRITSITKVATLQSHVHTKPSPQHQCVSEG